MTKYTKPLTSTIKTSLLYQLHFAVGVDILVFLMIYSVVVLFLQCIFYTYFLPLVQIVLQNRCGVKYLFFFSSQVNTYSKKKFIYQVTATVY